MSELFQIIETRSSIRAYKPLLPSAADIDRIVTAGLMAPTARNQQEVHISVVETRNPVAQEIQQALNPDAATNFYYNAPLLFVLSAADDFKWGKLDAGIAVENMHLAAKDLGLGSLIIGCIDRVLLGDRKAEFDEKLAIPAGASFAIALAVGFPDTEKAPHEFDAQKNVSYVEG